jgi:hypothetical protein
MVGTKLELLKEEISHYIGIPYWRNILKEGKIVKEGFAGGKGTATEIAAETIRLAKEQKVDLTKLTDKEIYSFQKKNKIGIDCSGLVYNLLDKYDRILGGEGIFNKTIGTDSKRGARRLSANMLTNSLNSISINDFNDIKTGDMIRMDEGRHVIFIIEKLKDIIFYIHSSERSKQRGVHFGTIDIIDYSKDLSHQKWSDTTSLGIEYNKLFNSQKGDGIFRLKCFA